MIVALADVEGLLGKDGLGGHLVHPAEVDALAELEDAGRRLAHSVENIKHAAMLFTLQGGWLAQHV